MSSLGQQSPLNIKLKEFLVNVLQFFVLAKLIFFIAFLTSAIAAVR